MATGVSVDEPAEAEQSLEAADRRQVALSYLLVFSAAAIAAGLARGVVTTYLPLLLDNIRSAPGLIGTAMLVNAVAGFTVPLVVGRWSDSRTGSRRRRMPFIVGGAALTAAGLAAIALGSSSYFLLLTALGASVYVGINALTTAHRTLVPDCFARGQRARATGSQEIAALAGGLVGVTAGGALTSLADWAPFAFAAAVVPLLTLPTVIGVREHVRAGNAKTEGEGEEAPETVAARLRASSRYYARSAARPGVRPFLLAQVLWVLGYAAMPAFFILYAGEVLGLAPARASLFLGGFGIITAIAIWIAGRVEDVSRHKPLLALGIGLMGVGFLGLAVASSAAAAAPGLVIGAFGFGLISTLGFPLFTELIPDHEEGGYTALFYSVRSIASAIALPAAGWAIAVTGSFRAMFFFGAVATMSALIPLATVPSPGGPGPLERVLARARATPPGWWIRGVAAFALAALGLATAVLLLRTTPLQSIDESLYQAINSLGPGGDLAWNVLNPHIRNYEVIVVVAVAAAALTRPRLIVPVLLVLAVSYILAGTLLEIGQLVWNRPRPEEVLAGESLQLHGVWASFASFPSGHVVISTALAAGTALAFPRLRAIAWLYIAAVGLSRIVFGAHFPLDVLAGVGVGYVGARIAFALVAELWGVPEWRARLGGVKSVVPARPLGGASDRKT